jgi:hypothetical protein
VCAKSPVRVLAVSFWYNLCRRGFVTRDFGYDFVTARPRMC